MKYCDLSNFEHSFTSRFKLSNLLGILKLPARKFSENPILTDRSQKREKKD